MATSRAKWREMRVASAARQRRIGAGWSGYALVGLALAGLLWLAPLGDRARAAGAGGQTVHGYRLGIFPYLPALTIDRIFGPIAASFATELGRPVYLKTRSTFETFAEELREQTYEIIFVYPFFYVEAADRYHYLPLARLDGRLTAVAMVRVERPWRTWSDLTAKTIAAPPGLAAVSELARLALLDAGLIPGVDATLQHYRTKMSCLRAVIVGAVDACVLPRFVLPQMKAARDGKLRIMAESPSIAQLVFAAHRRMAETEQTRLRAHILSWAESEPGQAILTAGAWPRFVAAQDSDYNEVRRLSSRLRIVAHR